MERSGTVKRYRSAAGGSIYAVVAAATLGISACNFEVINPGPIQDGFLDSTSAHPALVNGMRRNLADALDQIAYWGGALTFEINPAGSTGSFGIPTQIQAGEVDDENANGDWARAQQARWTAEDGIRRFQRVLPKADFDKSILVAQAYLFAGYANRLMGENFCDAVFDGGPKEPHINYFTRAEQQFREAIRIATNAGGSTGTTVANAATAGLASVLANLATWNNNNASTWAQAAAEAAKIPNSFRYQIPYSTQDQDQYNYIVWANGNQPYRAHTQWATWYETYFQNTGDPRVPWRMTTQRGDAAVQKFGAECTPNGCSVNQRVPWFPQDKYKTPDAPITLSSGWEMRLIQAEEALVRGDLTAALNFMNQRRQDLGLPLITAANLTEGWTALKAERAYELWLEARRVGDLRRWRAANTPGAIFDGVYLLQGGVLTRTEDTSNRSLCWPISRTEKRTNPNLGG
ncbi:MAG: hypothetical protein KatS3mg081_0700 [Gemmatimonadales bacterium]|nr:MAG: hypothetical protein KatS3mg081_0700 [Gemmatimonadales bacterium]